MKRFISTLALAAAAVGLAACTDVKKELGVARNSPDEFTVVKRAPLTLPPDYNLRPPVDPNTPMPEQSTTAQARDVVLGKSEKPVKEGAAEQAFLGKLGVSAAQPGIRQTIDEENGYISLKNQPVSQKLIFWNDTAPSLDDAPSSTVDAAKEKARLEKNKAEGKPVNEGQVPVIEKKKNTLEKLF